MDLHYTLTAILVFVTFLGHCWSCKCDRKHPQSDFCKHSFAIRGIVQAINKKPELLPYMNDAATYTYLIQIEEVYKYVTGFNISTGIYKFNGGDPALCGLVLELGKTYLLTGVYWRETFHLSNCDWNLEFNLLTKGQLDGITGAYDCRCLVKKESEYVKDIQMNTVTCYVPSGDESCMATRGQCQYVVNQCQWRVFQYEQCKLQNQQVT